MRSGFLIAGLALAALVILGMTYYLRQQDARPAAVAPVPPAQPAPPASAPVVSEPAVLEDTPPSPVITEPSLVLPPLDDSDAFVRERLAGSLPEAWLEKDDLLRRLSVVIENAARGEIPRRQLGFLAPEGRFLVREVPAADTGAGSATQPGDVRLFIDPRSYRRYDPYLDILENLPPETLARVLLDTYPLLEKAMAELGARSHVLGQLLDGIDEVLMVPVIREDVALVRPKVLYEYADPDLEALSQLQKQVLRMGPDNVARAQAYLKTLRTALMRR